MSENKDNIIVREIDNTTLEIRGCHSCDHRFLEQEYCLSCDILHGNHSKGGLL